MRERNESKRKRSIEKLFVACAVLAALAFAATPAEAHGRRHGHHGHRGHAPARAVVVPAPVPAFHYPAFVPHRISVADAYAYRAWYAGTVPRGPYRNAHALYRFPVVVNGAVAYRTYAYGGDGVIVDAAAAFPRLAFGLSVGPHGGSGGIAVSTPEFGFYIQGGR